MAFTVAAVDEDGVLKPTQPLPLKEQEKLENALPWHSLPRCSAAVSGTRFAARLCRCSP